MAQLTSKKNTKRRGKRAGAYDNLRAADKPIEKAKKGPRK